jgi:hypothetical protein
MDKRGVTDPILRKYNVLSWVRGYYQDVGENHGEHYEVLKGEQARLGDMLDLSPSNTLERPGIDVTSQSMRRRTSS